MAKPFVSIIIPSYHDWARLKTCLKALENQLYDREFYEIIVVNNDPYDSCPFESLPNNIKLIDEHKPGSYAARNAGLAIATGEIYGFTDSDCIPDPSWIENAVSFLQKNQHVKRVGGRVKLFFREDKLTPAEIYELFFAFPQESYVNKRGMAVTANMFAHKSVFDSVGPFRDDLLSGGDYEWAQRAQKNGNLIGYNENALVLHPARYNMKEIIRKTRRVTGGRHVLKKRGLLWAYGMFSFSILPPIKSMFSVLKSKGSFREKIVAIGIRYFLRVVRGFEFVRVYHFGNAKN